MAKFSAAFWTWDADDPGIHSNPGMTFKWRRVRGGHGADDYETDEGDAWTLYAVVGSERVGQLDVNVLDEDIHIRWIEVDVPRRRRGIASALLDEARRKFPERELDTSGFSDEGEPFWEAYARKRGLRGSNPPFRYTAGARAALVNPGSRPVTVAEVRRHLRDTNTGDRALLRSLYAEVDEYPRWQLGEIPASSVQVDFFDDEESMDRVAEYAEMGVRDMPPVVAVPSCRPGDWYVIDGRHRAAAVQELDLPAIPAYTPVLEGARS